MRRNYRSHFQISPAILRSDLDETQMNANNTVIHLIQNPVSASRYVQPMVLALTEAGYDAELWVEPNLEGDAFFSKMQVRKRLEHFSLVLNPFAVLRRLVGLWHQFSLTRPAGIHAHQTKSSLIPLLAASLAGIRVRIYHNHGSAYWGTKGVLHWAVGKLEKMNCALATDVLFVNPALRDMFVRDQLVDAEKARILGPGSACGLDLTAFPDTSEEEKSRQRQRLSLSESAFIVLYVGRPHKRKGFDFLLKAWMAAESFNSDNILLLAGCNEKDVKRVLGEVPVTIRALGICHEMPALYAASDVVVLPSEHEGVPYALLEGGACGRPLVVSDIPGIRMVVTDGVEGLVHPLNDTRAFLSCLSRLYADPTLRMQLGTNACGKAKRFERRAVLEHLVAFYKSVFRETTA